MQKIVNKYCINIFENIIKDIEHKNIEREENMGWRFLYCSKNNIEVNNGIYLITSNPGGDSESKDQEKESCEDGNAVLNEKWGNHQPGNSPLQKQIQELFKEIGLIINFEKILENALSGYFIPFRSPNLNKLKNKNDARDFGKSVWEKILKCNCPWLIICIDPTTYKCLKEILHESLDCKDPSVTKYQTGWGNVGAEITEYFKKGISIVRFPHLSTYTIFTCEKSKEKSKKILKESLKLYLRS
jgi:hypothetical protein